MARLNLKPAPLTREAFAPFGDVIETEGAKHFGMNADAFQRFHDLARVDVGSETGGRTLISIVQCMLPSSTPCRVPFMERHPLGTQAFIPFDQTPLILVVAPAGEVVDPRDVQAFVSSGQQGINYHRGVWHMPMISLVAGQRMLVVDRGGPGDNCDEFHFAGDDIVVSPTMAFATADTTVGS
jgi:ureidoglycolate lyase